jgi:TolA-binding protein
MAQENIRQGKFVKAAEIYCNIANRCDREQDKALYELKVCECIFKSGEYNKALPELNNLINNSKTTNEQLITKAMLLKGHIYIQLGDIVSASKLFTKTAEEYPKSKQAPEANFFIGYCKVLEGKLEEAREVFSLVVKDYPQSSYAGKAHLCLRMVERMIR